MKKRIWLLISVLVLCLAALSVSALAAGDVAINAANFPDDLFRAYVAENLDKDGDGVLSQSECKAVHQIRCNGNIRYSDEEKIGSVQGIEFFPNLESLVCNINRITSLDVSQNPKLQRLTIANNQIGSLDVSHNPALSILFCGDNPFTTVDISNNPYLILAFTQGEPNPESQNGVLLEITAEDGTYCRFAYDPDTMTIVNRGSSAPAETAKTGWAQDDGVWHFYDKNGKLTTNAWAKDGSYWCWMGADGAAIGNQWFKTDGKWYFFDKSGHAVTNGWAKDGSYWCWMDKNGIAVTKKWVQADGHWYYFDGAGHAVCNGWANDGSGWCWMDENGIAVIDAWVDTDEGPIYFDANGHAT